MENNLVIKANKLNESRYKLGVIEQRIVLTMIALIKPNDKDFKPYSFTIKEFAELTGVKRHNMYTRIKNITKTLRDKGIVIKELDGDLQIGWVSSVKYYDDEARLELMFDPALKPYLLALKKEFTRYQLKNTVRFRSAYSVRVYELLKQYQPLGSREFTLIELRDLLCIPEGKLKLYSNFKLKVLDVAERELKKSSDIYFVYKPIKTGRKVTAIKFHIEINKKVVKNSYKPKKTKEKKVLDTYSRENDLNVLNRQLEQFKNKYPEHYFELEKQAKNRLNKKDFKKPGVKTTIKFKMQSLLQGYLQKKGLQI